ncbi:hypothetical protein [Pseudoramibacter porci]|uniref:hypothetical protein n=1 Tax=Pseudoramibacter porci TaxID=2606631 RepID=UPI0038B5152F
MINYYCTVKDVMAITGVKESKAYNLIKQVNNELHKQGYITLRGKAPKAALFNMLGITETGTPLTKDKYPEISESLKESKDAADRQDVQ